MYYCYLGISTAICVFYTKGRWSLLNQYGLEVKKKLLEKGLNQRYIAEKIGLSQNGLSNALNRDNISLLQMQRIAESIGCKLHIELIDTKSE